MCLPALKHGGAPAGRGAGRAAGSTWAGSGSGRRLRARSSFPGGRAALGAASAGADPPGPPPPPLRAQSRAGHGPRTQRKVVLNFLRALSRRSFLPSLPPPAPLTRRAQAGARSTDPPQPPRAAGPCPAPGPGRAGRAHPLPWARPRTAPAHTEGSQPQGGVPGRYRGGSECRSAAGSAGPRAETQQHEGQRGQIPRLGHNHHTQRQGWGRAAGKLPGRKQPGRAGP